MDWEHSTWQQFNSNARGQWGRLTNDQLDLIAGRHDQLVTKIQELYAVGRSEAEMQVANWQKRMKKTAAVLGGK
jgi:uncharacterized protein YjbJ (UPF0337 family)